MTQAAKIEGLEKALFDQDYSQLRIELPIEEYLSGRFSRWDANDGLIIQGYRDQHGDFAAAHFYVEGAKNTPNLSGVLVGKLEADDPFARPGWVRRLQIFPFLKRISL